MKIFWGQRRGGEKKEILVSIRFGVSKKKSIMDNNFITIRGMIQVQEWDRFKWELNYELIIINRLKVEEKMRISFFHVYNSRFLFGFSTRYFVLNYQLLLNNWNLEINKRFTGTLERYRKLIICMYPRVLR